MARTPKEKKVNGGANLGFEAQMFQAADKMRGSMDASEYKHVALGLIFLKYISDAFEAKHTALSRQGEDAEDRDFYIAEIDLIGNIGMHEGSDKSKDILGRVYGYFLGGFAGAEDKRGGEISDWGGERLRDDVRWKHGLPPAGNANYAWLQHIIHHLAPNGIAGVVLANGSMSSNQSGEGDIRKTLIDNDLVDCMVALPGQLFYSTQIPACLWFLSRNKKTSQPRDRSGQILFIYTRKMGVMVDRTRRELTEADIQKVGATYHAWRGEKEAGDYADIPGFCKSAELKEVQGHGYVLTPGRYVGSEALGDDDEPFEQKFPRLIAELETQFTESDKLTAQIRHNLKYLGGGK